MALNNKNLQKKTLEKLLQIQEATKSVYDYYDNLAQANKGLGDDTNSLGDEYLAKRGIYYKFLEEVFFEIKKRVDNLL